MRISSFSSSSGSIGSSSSPKRAGVSGGVSFAASRNTASLKLPIPSAIAASNCQFFGTLYPLVLIAVTIVALSLAGSFKRPFVTAFSLTVLIRMSRVFLLLSSAKSRNLSTLWRICFSRLGTPSSREMIADTLSVIVFRLSRARAFLRTLLACGGTSSTVYLSSLSFTRATSISVVPSEASCLTTIILSLPTSTISTEKPSSFSSAVAGFFVITRFSTSPSSVTLYLISYPKSSASCSGVIGVFLSPVHFFTTSESLKA